MSWFTKTTSSTIGRKFFAGLSGLALVGFLVAHLVGNLQLFVSAEAMNAYGHFLHKEIPAFLAIEYGLLAFFVVHIVFVIGVTLRNRAARPQRYAVTASHRGGGASAWASRTMALSGITLLVFLVVHVLQLRMRGVWDVHPDAYAAAGGAGEGIGYLVVDTLGNPLNALLYIVGSVLAGWHVFHGFQSAFRSLGANHSKYTPLVAKLGPALGLVIALGFCSFPVAILAGFIDYDGTPLAPLFAWIHPLPEAGH